MCSSDLKDCPNYIRQAPQYHTKPNRRTGNPEIVNKSSYHAVDSVGYLLMSMPIQGPKSWTPPGEDELPPHLRPDDPYWQAAKDEASRQFAVNNHRDKGPDDEGITVPYGGEDDGWFNQNL